MRTYTVHLRRAGLDPVGDLVIVKEGFSWPAFFFSVFWALWCRLWLVAAGFIVLEIGAAALAGALGVPPFGQSVLSLGLAVAIGFVANDLRRHGLASRGFTDAGVVAAANHDEAARRFLDAHPEIGFAMGA